MTVTECRLRSIVVSLTETLCHRQKQSDSNRVTVEEYGSVTDKDRGSRSSLASHRGHIHSPLGEKSLMTVIMTVTSDSDIDKWQ